MEEVETYTVTLQEPNERTISLACPKHETLEALEDRIEELTRSTENWSHFQQGQFLILVRGVIINEQYTRNVKLQDIQGFDSKV